MDGGQRTHGKQPPHRRLDAIPGPRPRASALRIDFVRLQEDGQTYHGDPKDYRNYRCYGAEALAVANTRVADVRNGIPEGKPDSTERAVKMTLDTVSGNRLTLDLESGRFATYARLQPATIRVHEGTRVRDELPRGGWVIDFVQQVAPSLGRLFH